MVIDKIEIKDFSLGKLSIFWFKKYLLNKRNYVLGKLRVRVNTYELYV